MSYHEVARYHKHDSKDHPNTVDQNKFVLYQNLDHFPRSNDKHQRKQNFDVHLEENKSQRFTALLSVFYLP